MPFEGWWAAPGQSHAQAHPPCPADRARRATSSSKIILPKPEASSGTSSKRGGSGAVWWQGLDWGLERLPQPGAALLTGAPGAKGL